MDSIPLLDAKRQTLRALWRDKMHVEPQALERSPVAVRASYAHIWEPAEVWMQALEVLPLGLLCLWGDCSHGHLVFTAQASEYRPGAQIWQGKTLESVCYLSLADLRQNSRHAMWATLALVDHLLGSQAQPDGLWFSDGQGVTPHLRAAAARFVALHVLGYGAEELKAATARDYFAHALELYLTLPQRLNVLAPQMYRLCRHELMNEVWWS